MRLLLIPALVSFVFGFDVIEELLKQIINQTSDPCDDFYRHVCPLGTPDRLLEQLIFTNLENEVTPGVWDKLEIITDFKQRNIDFAQEIPLVAEKICKDGYDTTDVLEKLGQLFGESYVHLAYDSNCERVTQFIRDRIQESFSLETLQNYTKTLDKYVASIEAISFHLDQNMEETIAEINTMVEESKELVSEWILETPWANNNNVTDVTNEALQETVLNNKYAEIMRDSLDLLIRVEFDYRNCKNEYNNDESANSFCLFYTMDPSIKPPSALFFYPINNAFNLFPKLSFGFPVYYAAKNSNEYAAKAGFIGGYVGHELAHTLIKSRNDNVLTYFSEESVQCVQNQYRESCAMFKEISCEVDDVQIDENGADVLGVQIMYQLLENKYGGKLTEIYQPLNITYQQLFFYSNVIYACSGTPFQSPLNKDGSLNAHSTENVRANALVNHPAFQEAFKCKEDSRMMRSATNNASSMVKMLLRTNGTENYSAEKE